MRGFGSSARLAPIVVGLLSTAACSLTEEVRTRPGPPGDFTNFGDGGSPGDAGGQGGAGGADVRSGDAGARDSEAAGGRGTGGRPHTGGAPATDGGPSDAAPDATPSCPVEITFACHDYCNALSLAPGCRTKLRASVGLGPEPDASVVVIGDGATPPELPLEEIVEKCKCACETQYRTEPCRSSFDQFVMCGVPPLTTICSTDPATIDAFPSVIGPGCGGLRAIFLDCIGGSP